MAKLRKITSLQVEKLDLALRLSHCACIIFLGEIHLVQLYISCGAVL